MRKHHIEFHRKQRTEQGAKVSLFPFLAVLICTMGILILLLVVIARNMRLHGQNDESVPVAAALIPADWSMMPGLSEMASPIEVLEHIQDEMSTVDWLTGEIHSSQERTVEQLNDIRARIGVVEDSINKLTKEIEQTTAMIQSLVEGKHSPKNVELEQLRNVLSEKEQQRKQVEADLRTLQEKGAYTARSYAIVPYRGPGGTFRRPIYIECRSDSVVLQPEGVVLTASDFTTPGFRDNPLEMLVRTARQYLIETQQLERDTEPYPLFLVRPSGVSAYEAARMSLGSWKNDFGYELLEEDWNLEFPAPSEELQQRLGEQVQIARSRQTVYRESLSAAGGPKQQFRVSSRGGLEPVRGTSKHLRSSSQEFSNGLNNSGDGVHPDFIAGNNVNNVGANMGTNAGTGNPQLPEGGEGYTNTASPPQYGTQWTGGSDNPALNAPTMMFALSGPAGAESAEIGITGSSPHQPRHIPQQENATGIMAGSTDRLNMDGPQQGMPGFDKVIGRDERQNRQKNWALKGAEKTMLPVRRIVKLQCEKDQLVLLRQPGLVQNKVIPIEGSMETATSQLVEALWKYMDTWDMAGENKYWVPNLKVKVLPDAEFQFEQLQTALKESGLIINKE